MSIIKIFIITLLLTSCSTVEFINTSEKEVSFTPRPGHSEEYMREFVARHYLWGMLPEKITFDFKEVINDLELNSVASLEVKKESRVGTYLWPILTAGFVTPKYFVLKFKGQY